MSSQDLFPHDKGELLRSLERFDGEIIAEDEVDSGKCDNSRYIHTSFLEVLLECVCSSIVKNDVQRENLLIELCRRLSQSNFINEELLLHTLPLRKQLSKMFFDYVKQVCEEIIPDTDFDCSTISFLEENHESFDNVYKTYFEELEEIGRGGFGVVCKARHRSTGTLYAVKKIYFNYKNDFRLRRVLREAKNIAALNHPNVVHYNSAWTEAPSQDDDLEDFSSDDSNGYSTQDNSEASLNSERASTLKCKENGSDTSESTYFSRVIENNRVQYSLSERKKEMSFNENSSFIIFKESFSSPRKNVTWSFGNSSKNKGVDYDSNDEADSVDSDDSVNLNVRAKLYIQMEYCDCDLRHWLNERAKGNPLPFEMDVTDIFINIINGVAHIHSKNIIHRDLKPQNIFYSKSDNSLKIGDFGLATLSGFSDVSNVDISNLHSTNIGTLPYAAPEQIKYKSYDSKVDIYSLGIILIELLKTFSTIMELSRTIDEIKKGKFPNEMKESPKFINLVKNLLNENPELRMSAKEVLNYLQEDSKLTLEDREMAIREKEIFLIEKELELRQKEAALNEKELEFREKEAAVDEKKLELREKETALDEKELELREKEAALDEKELKLRQKETTLKDVDY